MREEEKEDRVRGKERIEKGDEYRDKKRKREERILVKGRGKYERKFD